MASFDTLSTWINQSFYSASTEDEGDEFVVEFPSYDFQSSPIYLLSDSDTKETILNRTYTIAAIELINDTELLSNLTSTSSKFDSFLLLLQDPTVASTLSILLAVFLYALSLLTLLGNGIVVYAILTERKLRTVSAHLVFNRLACVSFFLKKRTGFF